MKIIYCTKEHPWDKIILQGQQVHHANVEEVGNSDEVARYKCKNCGHSWKEELPQ